MNNELQLFGFEDQDVRILFQGNTPWFVLKDVCDVLGLQAPHMVAGRLEEDERSQASVIDSMGREQNTTIINESGLYAVISRSDKPEAKRFQRWVNHEVLPSIRKYGVYSTGIPKNYVEALRLAADQALEIESKNLIIQEAAPKVEFYDTVTTSPDCCDMGTVSKLLNIEGVGRNTMFKILKELKILDRANAPYQRHVNAGYFKRVENFYYTGEIPHLTYTTVVYQKGVDFIRKSVLAYLEDRKSERSIEIKE